MSNLINSVVFLWPKQEKLGRICLREGAFLGAALFRILGGVKVHFLENVNRMSSLCDVIGGGRNVLVVNPFDLEVLEWSNTAKKLTAINNTLEKIGSRIIAILEKWPTAKWSRGIDFDAHCLVPENNAMAMEMASQVFSRIMAGGAPPEIQRLVDCAVASTKDDLSDPLVSIARFAIRDGCSENARRADYLAFQLGLSFEVDDTICCWVEEDPKIRDHHGFIELNHFRKPGGIVVLTPGKDPWVQPVVEHRLRGWYSSQGISVGSFEIQPVSP